MKVEMVAPPSLVVVEVAHAASSNQASLRRKLDCSTSPSMSVDDVYVLRVAAAVVAVQVDPLLKAEVVALDLQRKEAHQQME